MKDQTDAGVSKVKLALGAASLFLFLVGVKRTFRTEEGDEIHGGGEQQRSRKEGKQKGRTAGPVEVT